MVITFNHWVVAFGSLTHSLTDFLTHSVQRVSPRQFQFHTSFERIASSEDNCNYWTLENSANSIFILLSSLSLSHLFSVVFSLNPIISEHQPVDKFYLWVFSYWIAIYFTSPILYCFEHIRHKTFASIDLKLLKDLQITFRTLVSLFFSWFHAALLSIIHRFTRVRHTRIKKGWERKGKIWKKNEQKLTDKAARRRAESMNQKPLTRIENTHLTV